MYQSNRQLYEKFEYFNFIPSFVTPITILNINQASIRVIIDANTSCTKLFLHPLNDQLDLDVISVKAFPHFSAICVVIAVFVIFNCFLLIMLFALKLLPLQTQMQTNAICWRNFIFPYRKHFFLGCITFLRALLMR